MHIFIHITFVLFCWITIHAHANSNEDVLYPPHWQLAPSTLAEYPLINESISSYRLIDPWYYPHRLGLFKILINITSPYMPFCASSNASNILFALPSQFGWLFRSNRLFTNGTMDLSLDSWWASANYYLSVVPFLVAFDLDLMPKEPFRLVQHENFCSNSFECSQQIPQAMEQWKIFFIHLQQSSDCLGNEEIDQRMIDKCYLGSVWSAYKSSIFHALPLVHSKLDKLPSDAERFFGLAWGRLINLISMTRKNTDLYATIENQRKFLPFRMLNQSDQSGDAEDLPALVNRSLKVLFSFRFDRLTIMENVWRRLTCNYQSRVYAQRTLDVMAISKLVAIRNIVQAAISAFLHECDQ